MLGRVQSSPAPGQARHGGQRRPRPPHLKADSWGETAANSCYGPYWLISAIFAMVCTGYFLPLHKLWFVLLFSTPLAMVSARRSLQHLQCSVLDVLCTTSYGQYGMFSAALTSTALVWSDVLYNTYYGLY